MLSNIIFPMRLRVPYGSAQGPFVHLCRLGIFHVAQPYSIWNMRLTLFAFNLPKWQFHVAQSKSLKHAFSFWNYAKLCFPFGILAKPCSWWARITLCCRELSWTQINKQIRLTNFQTTPLSTLSYLHPFSFHLLQKQKQRGNKVCGIGWGGRCLSTPDCRESSLGQAVLFCELCYFVHTLTITGADGMRKPGCLEIGKHQILFNIYFRWVYFLHLKKVKCHSNHFTIPHFLFVDCVCSVTIFTNTSYISFLNHHLLLSHFLFLSPLFSPPC